MKLTSNGNVIFLGGDNGVSIRSVWNLEELHNLDSTECGGPVTYLNLILGKSRYALVAQRLIFIDDHFLLIGSSTGEFSVLMDPVMKGKMLQQMKLP